MKTTTRIAKLKTWQPSKQKERTLKTRRVPFISPGGLIKASSKLWPGWKVLDIQLFDGETQATLILSFGTDKDGVMTSVDVKLPRQDLPAMAMYLLARTKIKAFCFIGAALDRDDEELIVPKVSPAELEAMQSASSVPC